MTFKLRAFKSGVAAAARSYGSAMHRSDSATTGYSLEERTALPAKPDAENTESSITISTLLLDLSGNREAAATWAHLQLPGLDIRSINKADLKWESKRKALERVRKLAPHTFAIFTSDLDMQSARGALMMFAVLAGSRRVVFGDSAGRTVSRSRWSVLLIEAPRFSLELLIGYGVVVPLSWLLALMLQASLGIRQIVRRERAARQCDPNQSSTALYLRATLSSAGEGGMNTHVAGFLTGAARLGHALTILESARTAPSGQEPLPGVYAAGDRRVIKPSARIGPTKALFELWNNLVFTAKSLQLIGSDAGHVDFIYQRYSRFNFTGVMLSLVTGLPLALEFNGSEVWVSKHWDPIGQFRLLKRFEQLNLRGADLIFVVSEIASHDLVGRGLAAQRVLVNPNGVDTDKFHPDCGGCDVRRALAIEHKIVVGFVGTFGPWHGAPVLAEAAGLVKESARCHFLFVGDGDERDAAEQIIQAAPQTVSATFTGRVAHDKVAAYLDACDILVSPHVGSADGSGFFGSPTKLFEYMAMARPVVASRLGQIADVIRDRENGFLVDPGDPKALAHAIEILAESQPLRERLGAAARRTVIEGYTWRHNAGRVFEHMAHRQV
jgi:glycosyltransferase involved in cell wall biosynthesis